MYIDVHMRCYVLILHYDIYHTRYQVGFSPNFNCYTVSRIAI